jgi:serine phosphatase RsbU (regulator of sigma subunit)
VYKKQILQLLFLFCGLGSMAGTPALDSLVRAVARMPADTNKVRSIIKLVFKQQHGDPKLALAYTDSMLALSEQLHYRKGIAYSYHYFGILYTDQKAFSRALENLQKADSVYKLMNDVPHSCNILNSTGNIYYHMKEYDKAMDYYKKAVDQFRTIGDAGGMAMEMNNIGSVFSEAKNYDKALYYYQQALPLREREKDTSGICSTLGSIGEIYDYKKEDSLALLYYHRALGLSQVAHDAFYQINAYAMMASFFDNRSQADSAVKYMMLVLQLSQTASDPDRLKEAYSMLSRIYTEKGQPAPAYDYYKKYIQLRDSLFSKENAQKFVQTEMNFQFEKEEAEKKAEREKKEEVERSRKQTGEIIRNAFIAGLAVVLLIGIVIVRGNTRKKKDNIQLEAQKQEISRQKQEIQDSINYAKYIQDAILPGERLFDYFNDAFVLFKPKDVVSGDFYLSAEKQGTIFLAVADCTGHGVPGAFMSLVAYNKLQGVLMGAGNPGPSVILAGLNDRLVETLGQEKKDSVLRDGMDIALIRFDPASGQLDYAGANRPLWIIRGTELIELLPDKISIGGYTPAGTVFNTRAFTVQKGDCVYLFSDGYADQFGGDRDKKYTTRRFRELLLAIAGEPMAAQRVRLEQEHVKWREHFVQTDDILVIGIRI